MLRKKNIITILAIIFVFVFSVWLVFFTTLGVKLINKLVVSRYIKSEDINIESIEGNIFKKVSLQNVEIIGLEGLPVGSRIKIQNFEFQVTGFNVESVYAEIDNGKMSLPDLGDVLFYGKLEKGVLEFNIYSGYISVREIANLIPVDNKYKNVLGTISDLDVYVKGLVLEPELIGKFNIKKIVYDRFTVEECLVNFDLKLKEILKIINIYGEIQVEKGKVFGMKTAVINLQQSKVYFDGDMDKISFNFKGKSEVERVKIDIELKGNRQNPDLKLESEPPLSKSNLLIMLATGKKWKFQEEIKDQVSVAPGLAMDFIDYFMFGNSRNKLAEKLGVSEISFTMDETTKGVSVSKEITDKTEVSYGIEQSQQKEGVMEIKQKVGATYKITESLSIEGEQEVMKAPSDNDENNSAPEQKLFLKFEKDF
ncbi:MAG: translocation/assembly module TamB domain-containing protein [Candidatus Omnitrophica bacterium]|nr:translocation/assembly module TamB domain-containing protein [Candidatus Omnitrophota bacterium]